MEDDDFEFVQLSTIDRIEIGLVIVAFLALVGYFSGCILWT